MTTRTLLSTLTLCLSLGALGCTDDDSSIQTLRSAGGDADEPTCLVACEALLDQCDGDDTTQSGSDVQECVADCVDGVILAPEEIACLAELTCGDPTDGCLE